MWERDDGRLVRVTAPDVHGAQLWLAVYVYSARMSLPSVVAQRCAEEALLKALEDVERRLGEKFPDVKFGWNLGKFPDRSKLGDADEC